MHPDHVHMKRRSIAEGIKKETFSEEPISATAIQNKLHNMYNNWKQTKAEPQRSGFGARPEEGELTIAQVLNKRCRWYDRLDNIFSRYEKKKPGEGMKQSQSQSQAVAQPDMEGDSLTGLPTIARGEDEVAGEEGDAVADSAAVDQPCPQNDPDFPTTQTVPLTPTPVQRAAQVPPTAENQHKRRRTDRSMRGAGARKELEDLNELGQMRIEANKAEAIEIARIQAEEETRQFEKTTGLIDKLVDTQVALMRMQQEQQGKLLVLLSKVLKRND
ncbi:hypothetical protein KEM55_000310 [Ascosphaera atra]|nr:hypothetical protein KEM55_000310 [Ascosphaera atra]